MKVETVVPRETTAVDLLSSTLGSGSSCLRDLARSLRVGMMLAAPFLGTLSADAQEGAGPILPPPQASSPEPGRSLAPAAVYEGINTIDGRTIAGSIFRIDSESVVLKDASRELVVPRQQILHIFRSAAPDAGKPAILEPVLAPHSVSLSDGSILSGRLESLGNRDVTITVAGTEVKLPASHVRAIRFMSDAAYDNSWAEIVSRERHNQELLVIRRDAGQLDYLAGGVGQVTAEKVEFFVEEKTLAASRAKVFGLVISRRGDDTKTLSSICRLQIPGNDLLCNQVSVDGNSLSVTTIYGTRLNFAAENYRLDFSVSRASTLGDMQSVVKRWNPLAGLEGGRLHQAMLDQQSQPVMTQREIRNGFETDRVSFSGQATVLVPLRSAYSSMTADLAGNSSFKIILEQQDGTRVEHVIEPALNGSARTIFALDNVRTMSIEIPPATRIDMRDLRFIRRSR